MSRTKHAAAPRTNRKTRAGAAFPALLGASMLLLGACAQPDMADMTVPVAKSTTQSYEGAAEVTPYWVPGY